MKKSELRQIIKEEINKLFEQEVSQEVKDEVIELLKSFNGKKVPDEKIHAIAEKHGISPHDLEDWIYSLASQHVSECLLKKEDKIAGGKGDKKSPEDVDKNELAVGIEVEMEHTSDKETAKEIALDHLTEKPKYYSLLIKAGIVDEKSALELAKKLGVGK